jgi:hypothetical protein
VFITIVHDVLLGLAVLAAYGLLVLVKPKMGCRKCSGNGSRKRLGRARSACGRCQGTGRQFRPGARLVHAGAVLAADSIRERIERRREERQ